MFISASDISIYKSEWDTLMVCIDLNSQLDKLFVYQLYVLIQHCLLLSDIGSTSELVESLHPSWAASKIRKQQQSQIGVFQGKKITFDDSE